MAGTPPREAEDEAPQFYKRQYSGKRVLSNRIRTVQLEELIVALAVNPNVAELRQTMVASYHVLPELSPLKLLEMMTSIFSHPNISIDTGDVKEGAGEGCAPSASDVRQNVVAFLAEWVDAFYDFADDEELLSQLQKWAARKGKAEASVFGPLNEALQAFEKRKCNCEGPLGCMSPREQATSEVGGEASFSLFSSKYGVDVVAQHLTTLEHRIILDIRPREYLVAWQNAPAPDSMAASPHLFRYLEHFKSMRAYFIAELSKHQSAKAQSQAIKRAIQIAQYCVMYNNFNTTMEILSALFSPVIIDPKRAKSWEMLNSKWFEILEQLCNLMSPDDNHKSYRATLKSAGERCVPFLGVHVEDVRFIMDFNPTQTVEGVNLGKLLQLKRELAQLRHRCKDEYQFPNDRLFADRILAAIAAAPAPEVMPVSMPTAPRPAESAETVEDDSAQADKKDTGKGEKKATRQNRMQELWAFSENFYSDAGLIGSHFVAVKDFHLRERDHKVLSTGASIVTFEEGTVIIEQGLLTTDAAVCLLSKGSVSLERSGLLVTTVSAPCLLNHASVLQTGQTTPLYKATSKVELYIIDRAFLMSVLETDSDLSLHFFTDLAFRLIEELTRNRIAAKGGRSRKAGSRAVNRVRALSQTGSSQRIPQTVRPAKPNQNLGRMMDPKMQRDQEFLQLFEGIIDEVILREYRATMLGRTLNVQGTLFVSQAHLCFYAKIFNHKSKAVIPLADLVSISQKKNKLVVEWSSAQKRRKAVFRLRDDEDVEVVTLVNSISSSIVAEPTQVTTGGRGSVDPRLEKAESMECQTSSLESWRGANSLGLTSSDWELLLRGAKRITFRKDAVIVAEGSTMQRIFQVVKGHCRIEKQGQAEMDSFVLGTIGANEIFGEMGFVQCQPASASVVAESDEVELYVIEGYYLSRLMQMRMELLARFLHYICTVMQRRLMSRNRLEDQEERKVVDIITEPLHLNLVRHQVVPLGHTAPIHVICGPKDDDMEEVENCYSSAVPFSAGTAVSTYPMRDIPDPEDPSKKIAKRDGSPICDQYRVNVYESRIIAAVADGCNWGDPPRNAAVAARDAFVSYLESHQEEITDVQFCGALILRALSMANAAIFRGLNPETQQIGTTTLLGGIVLKMQDEDGGESGNAGEEDVPEDTHNWGFVYGSIGDCKAFHWSKATGKFADITASNRTESLSASDCGGRLGPHIQGCLPDLRNLELGFYPCDEGDYFMIVSDGVHDNLDPQHLGFEPLDLGLSGESWATVPDLEVAEEAKTRYRLELLQKIIKREIDSKSPIDQEEREIMRKLTDKVNRSSMNLKSDFAEDEAVNRLAPPFDVVRQLTCYCREICAASADWMRENPSKRLPKDYRLYPGKMDHTTCVCFVVGDRAPKS